MDQEILLCVSLLCFSLTFFFIIIFVFCRLCCVEVPARRACKRGGGVCGLCQLRSTVFSGSWMLYLVSSLLRPDARKFQFELILRYFCISNY
uniref:Uncharacterized protein n=1 Tax=Ixodes ricinus TaxID=34613 RepID=A0A147BCX8_IXORI